MKSNRREFLKTCGALSAGLACGGLTLLAGCGGSVRYLPFDIAGNVVVVKKTAFLEQPSAAVKTRSFPTPIYLYRHGDDDYSAVLMQCTHKQCELSAAGDRLACPCHGSEFSHTGEVLQPPAEKPLHRFTVRTDAENLYIEL